MPLLLVLTLAACATPNVELGPPAAPWPAPIVTAGELSGDYLLLDARGSSAYNKGHAKGAVHADWTKFRKGLLIGGELLPTRALSEGFAKLGVRDDRRVLVCGAGKDGWGEEGRIAWTLRYLGHPAVALLSGGCKSLGKWTKEATKVAPGKLRVRIVESMRAKMAEVKTTKAQILDARTPAEYKGATPYYEARGGHIPRAISFDYQNVFDSRGFILPKSQLLAKLRAAGVDPQKPIVAYCTGGVRSAMLVEVLRAYGVDAKNYDASFWQWAEDRKNPLE